LDILIVDDEAALLDSLIRVLSGRLPGLTFAGAEDFEQAERLIVEHTPALVVSDVRLPGKSGVELFFTIQEKWPRVRFILMSGYQVASAELVEVSAAACHFIEKPFKIDDLVQQIQRALPSDEFSGHISGISLTDLLQLLNFGHHSVMVELDHLGEAGRIVFAAGEVVHAEQGELQGVVAFNRLIGWRDGSFKVVRNTLPSATTIDTSFNGLMMAAAQQLDEAQRGER